MSFLHPSAALRACRLRPVSIAIAVCLLISPLASAATPEEESNSESETRTLDTAVVVGQHQGYSVTGASTATGLDLSLRRLDLLSGSY